MIKLKYLYLNSNSYFSGGLIWLKNLRFIAKLLCMVVGIHFFFRENLINNKG